MMLMSLREPVHDGSLGVTESPALRDARNRPPPYRRVHPGAAMPGRHRHQPPDADMRRRTPRAPRFPPGALVVSTGSAVKHCAAVKHSLVQRPLRADQALPPRSQRRRRPGIRLGREAGTTEMTHSVSGTTRVPSMAMVRSRSRSGTGLARIGRNIVEKPRDQATERFVDAGCLLVDRHVPMG